jgi:FkbM family methyltransferase
MMISWAQNLEDVMLARALADVEQGFYVDVGAFDPRSDSVTRHFYEHGWRGINIDPLPSQIAPFVRERPRDVNLAVAVAATAGTMRFFDFSPVGLSTLDATVAAQMRARGFECREIEVPVTTLADVLDAHAPGTIDFLKIDVEGGEHGVLAGADFARHRPRIVVVEATAPMRPDATHATWEPLLLRRGYVFAWFDGLNRFYVRREDAERLRHFRVQPNVFDDYVRGIALREADRAGLARLRRIPARTRRMLSSTGRWIADRMRDPEAKS